MTGRTIALTSPRTRAETSSVVVEVKTMPGTMRALTASATPVTSQWIRKERILIDYPTPPRLPTPAAGDRALVHVAHRFHRFRRLKHPEQSVKICVICGQHVPTRGSPPEARTGAARVLPRRGVVRSDNEAVVVNLDITPVEKPEAVRWVDPIHK